MHGFKAYNSIHQNLNRIPKNEKKPDKKLLELFKDNKDVHEIQKIKSKLIDDDGITFYDVKFKGVRKSVWIPRNQLIKDAPVMVNLFEKKNTNKK